MRLLSLWFPLVGYALLLTYESSNALPTALGQTAYLLHGLAYLLFAILMLRVTLSYRMPFPFAAAIAFTVLFAASDELHQLFVPGRSASWMDILADALGASLVLVFKEARLRWLLLLERNSRARTI